MGKDSDVSVKKRRKLSTNQSVEKPQVVDMYKKVIDFEEKEAAQRSSDKDEAIFRKTCGEIRAILAEIAELKAARNDANTSKINEKRIDASLLLVVLKKLNRLEKMRAKAGRDALHKEKQRLDSTHLLLQNLLYEADHLDKEVTKRIQFKSTDEDIELVSVEEFYKEAPPEISKPETTETDKHQQRLARLDWELQQRRQLSKSCNELAVTKDQVASTIADVRSRLAKLKPLLRGILEATRPVQEMLSMKLDEKRQQHRISSLLPPPLFLLYANAFAYADVFGNDMLTVAIHGDEEEARRVDSIPDILQELANDSESDQELNDIAVKKKRHRKNSKISKEDQAEEKKKQALRIHPLSVKLTVKNKDGTKMSLVFTYMIQLKIVTVKASIAMSKPATGVSAADVLSGFNVLHELYANDDGTHSPHPATKYIFKTVGINEDFSEFLAELGRPYLWAQKMCGLNFPTVTDNATSPSRTWLDPCANLSGDFVEKVLTALMKRLKARIGLMIELQDLENGKIMPFEGAGVHPIRLLGSLTQWQTIGWPEYSQAAATGRFIEAGIVAHHDLLYRAIITRQSAKLVALVAVKSDYPETGPVIALTLHWNGLHHAGTDDDIRDIERCVNADRCEPKRSLSGRLTQLLACLDVLLEAIGSAEFPPDKIMLRPVRGRNRAKPYKFLKQGSGIFTQY